MNFYDVLAAEKWSGGIPTINFFDLLFAQSLGGGEQWETYEGTLPATIISTGANMHQYQIYGNTGGVGDDSGTAYGYKLDMAIGSNILQSSEIEQGGWGAAAGTVPEKTVTPIRCRSKNIYQISGEKIVYDYKSLNVNIAFVNSNGDSLGGSGFKTGTGSVDVPANAAKCLFIIANTDVSTNITPAQVIAAGIWASVDTTATPIYIGDTPLEKDEYVDYGEQKVFRRTVQLFDKSKYIKNSTTYQSTAAETPTGISITSAGNDPYVGVAIGAGRDASVYKDAMIEVAPEETYTISASALPKCYISYIDADYISLSYNQIASNPYTFTTPANCKLILLRFGKQGIPVGETFSFDNIVLLSGSTAAQTFIPYLQPTDPPVPLPALPTVEGTTIIDYTGSGTAPEKVYFEYQGGKQP